MATYTAYRLGSVATNDISKARVLAGISIAATDYVTFETPVGTDYVVPTGYTLYITAFLAEGIDGNFVIGYGDTGVASGDAAPTNWKQMTGELNTKVGNASAMVPIFVPIPADKYPCLYTIANALEITIAGVEVAD